MLLRIFGTELLILDLESNPAILPVFLGSVVFSYLSCTVKLLQPFHESHCLPPHNSAALFASGKVTHSFILPHKCWAWRCSLTVTYAGVLSLNQALAVRKNSQAKGGSAHRECASGREPFSIRPWGAFRALYEVHFRFLFTQNKGP